MTMNNLLAKNRKTTVLPRSTVDYLKKWMMSPEHVAHPYPTEKEKTQIMADTGIELKQLTNWFVNNRKRFWKPRVEARLQQHVHAQIAVAAPFPTRTLTQSIGSNIDHPVNINPVFSSQQPDNSMAFHAMNVIAAPSPEASVFQMKEAIPTPLTSFQIITNHHTFAPPPCSIDVPEYSSQIVSMGSVSYSYSSDSDTNSLSNGSNDSCQEINETTIFSQVDTPEARRIPLRKRQVILGDAIAKTLEAVVNADRKIVSPSHDNVKRASCTMKRVRSKSDVVSDSSPRNIIVRPRSLTFSVPSTTDAMESQAPKRRFVEDWQSTCRNARHGYDTALPTMEEAASLFGYAQKH